MKSRVFLLCVFLIVGASCYETADEKNGEHSDAQVTDMDNDAGVEGEADVSVYIDHFRLDLNCQFDTNLAERIEPDVAHITILVEVTYDNSKGILSSEGGEINEIRIGEELVLPVSNEPVERIGAGEIDYVTHVMIFHLSKDERPARICNYCWNLAEIEMEWEIDGEVHTEVAETTNVTTACPE